MRKTSATVYVLFAALLWSTGGLGVKSVDLAPLALAGVRSAFAVPVLAAALLIEAARRGISIRQLFAMGRRPLILGAAASYAVMVVTFVVACKLTTAANAILLQYTGPVYVALLSWPLLRERVRPIDLVATFACVAGMALLFAGKVSPTGRTGDLVAVVSSWGFAGVPLLMRLEDRRRGAPSEAIVAPLLAMVVGNLLACVACAPSMAAASTPSAAGWATLGYLGVFQIGIAYVLYGAAVNTLPALQSTLLATIEPVLNPLWVAIGRGETPSATAVLGGAIIVLGVTLQAAMRTRPVSS